MSKPFIENASINVAINARTSDFTNQCGVKKYTNAPEIIIIEMKNIVSDPATDFVDPKKWNSLLFIAFPAIAANPSPYPIIVTPTSPYDGRFHNPNERRVKTRSEIA